MKIQKKLLTKNKFSRPGIKLNKVTNIAVHYAGDPGASAANLNAYFESLKEQIPDPTGKYWVNKDGSYRLYKGQKILIRYVSSHFEVGLNGEIIQNLPLDEWSYCTNSANGYSISIECCHPDASGKFNQATEDSLVELCAYLLEYFNLTPNDIIRHYDVTRKQCPKYWSPSNDISVATANARFQAFKDKVAAKMGNVTTTTKPTTTTKTPTNTTKVTKITTSTELPFKVQIICDSLNVRRAPGLSSQATVVGVVKKDKKFTITETRAVGNVVWGKLKVKVKNGEGWISLGSKYVKYDSKVKA